MTEAIEKNEERPTKKLKIEASSLPLEIKIGQPNEDQEAQKEFRAGITVFVSSEIPGFSAILKQRYTDFIVNEISPSGEILHLTVIAKPTSRAAKAKPQGNEPKPVSSENEAKVAVDPVQITAEERIELIECFGEDTTAAIENLYYQIQAHPKRKRRELDSVTANAIENKIDRTKAHETVRRIFNSKIESQTGDDYRIVFGKGSAPKNGSQPEASSGGMRGRPGWEDIGGEYLHFTLYKENKETMEVLNFLCSQLKLKSKTFQFAGTKDRRAVTVQRVSGYRVPADKLSSIATKLRGAKIGHYKYENYPLTLGELEGNQFAITLRECHFQGEEGLTATERLSLAKSVLDQAGESLKTKGFINYFGLQRFGIYKYGTHEVGRALLQDDFKTAIDYILYYSPDALAATKSAEKSEQISSDDQKRAQAIHMWETTKQVQKAIAMLPKRFSAEFSLIRHLGASTAPGHGTNERDYQGALNDISRNLKLMYPHAYQGLVWNTVAGERWKRYGDRVIEGDLIVVDTPQTQTQTQQLSYDDSGEVILSAAEGDKSATEDTYTRARPLTKEEAESGIFTIWDVVLTLPGYDVEYPKNDIGAFYVEFMASEVGGGLDPYNMRRRTRDFSLSGKYRKLMARPANLSWCVKPYKSEFEQLVETDMDRIHGKKIGNDPSGEIDGDDTKQQIAVILNMQLGSSQYATIALREMLKLGGLKNYTSNGGGGRDR